MIDTWILYKSEHQRLIGKMRLISMTLTSSKQNISFDLIALIAEVQFPSKIQSQLSI